jgi:hypothetical protein
VDSVTEAEIRASFVNCSRGAATRLAVPADLAGQPWADLDFLGWTEPGAPDRAHLVVPEPDGLVGITLRRGSGGQRRAQMCAACRTTHAAGGVALVAAPKAGESGRRGNTVGTYLCADLACSLYARGLRTPALGRSHRDDTPVEDRVEHVRATLAALVARVRG